jgi:hypothetical protein
MAESERDTKVWNIANLIIAGMGFIIACLVSTGFYSISNKIEVGDAAIYARLSEIKQDVKGLNDCIIKMQSDITRIDTLQRLRLDKENREMRGEYFKSVPK